MLKYIKYVPCEAGDEEQCSTINGRRWVVNQYKISSYMARDIYITYGCILLHIATRCFFYYLLTCTCNVHTICMCVHVIYKHANVSYISTYAHTSRLMIVSCEAKKKLALCNE